MSVTYFPGRGWCDVVALPDGGFAGVYSIDGAVVCVRLGGAELWRVSVPTDHLRYLRAAYSPAGDVAAIGVGSDDIAYVVMQHRVAERWGVAHGQNPVGIYADGAEFIPVIQRTSESYSVGQDWRAFPPHIKGTSQGFRDVTPDGTIRFGDDWHVKDVNGIRLHKPCERGWLVVGQIDGSDRIDGVAGIGTRFTAIPGPAYEPHCAEGQAQYAVCARTPHGAAFLIVPPYPPVEDGNTPIPPDPEPPDPKPEEPKPVAIPDLRHIVQQVSAAHPHLIAQNTRETVKELYWRCVWALHQADPKFGFLSKSEGENHQIIAGHRVSVDAAAYQGSDQVVDFIGSAGDGPGTGSVGWGLDERRPSNVWIQPVAPQVPTGGDGGDPGDENDQLKPRVKALEETVSELRATIAALRTDNAALHAQLDALASKPPQEIDIDALLGLIADRLRVEGATSRDLYHSHKVNLKVQP